MNLFSMFLADEEASTSSGAAGSNDSWVLFVVLGALVLLYIAYVFYWNKKREKQGAEMLSLIKVGVKVKTLGGFVGTIEKIDEEKALLTLNIGTEDFPTYVVIDKTYICQIEKPETVDGQSEGNSDDIFVYDSGDTNTELKKENGSEDASETEEASIDEKSE